MGVSGPQVVEGWYGQPFAQAAGPHPRGRRHHPPGAGPRGAGDQRRPALPAAVHRRGLGRARQAAQADRAPAARRHPDLARRRGTEERRADRRDRRRLDPDLLHAQVAPACTSRGSTRASPGPARGVPAPTSRSPPPATCRSSPTPRRSSAVIDAMKPVVALYMGGMGAKEQNFHKQVFERMGYEDARRRGAGALPRRREGRGHRADPRRARRRHAHHRHARPRSRSGSRQWEETGVTTLLLSCGSADEVRRIAELLA